MVFSLYSTRRAAVKAPEVKVECMHDAAKLAHRRMKGYDAEFDRVLARLPRWSLRIDLPSRADRFYIPAFRMLRHLRQVFDVTCQGRSAWLVAHENAKIVIELGDDDDDGNDGYCSVVVRGAIAALGPRQKTLVIQLIAAISALYEWDWGAPSPDPNKVLAAAAVLVGNPGVNDMLVKPGATILRDDPPCSDHELWTDILAVVPAIRRYYA